MVERLGNVLYWAGCTFAALALAIAAAFALLGNGSTDAYFMGGLFAVASAVIWLIGRAIKYVLTGL